jgi:hypothetical protein
VDAWLAVLVEFAMQLSQREALGLAALGALVLALLLMIIRFATLNGRYHEAEAKLFEHSVDKHSTNWASTAQNLERKAMEPGEVARKSTLTHLHMLDEAANAWLKGSHWPKALSVTQDLLRESCHAIGKPSIQENEFRAAADLIARRLETYPDLSKAVDEATDNALRFLDGLDKALSIFVHDTRVAELRQHVAAAREAVEHKPEAKTSLTGAIVQRFKPASNSDTPKTL